MGACGYVTVSAGALRVQRTPGIGGPGSWEPLNLDAVNGYWLLLTEEPFSAPPPFSKF